MPFERLRLRNVRCFRETEIRLHEKLTVIVGGNATGKTTMMEALASVTHGDDEGLSGFPLRHGAQHGEVSVYEANGNQSVARWRSGEKGRRRLPSGRYAFL
jgi:recombinational DNA repair ATPase RecF